MFGMILVATASSAGKLDAQNPSAPPERLGGVTACVPAAPDTTKIPEVPRVVIAGPVERALPPCRVPISPRSAFLRSLLVPGLGQRKLDRPRAARLFIGIEAGAIGMAAKSLIDLNRAKAARRDTVVLAVLDPATGMPAIDPVTRLPRTETQPRNRNLADRVRARRTHLEDWLAAIAFNHLFAGADAYVAANLADFATNVQVTSAGKGVTVMARVAW